MEEKAGVRAGRAPLGALVPAGANHSFDVGLHDELQDRLGDRSEEIARAVLLKQLGMFMLGLVIGGPFGDGLKSANSALTVHLDCHPALRSGVKGNPTTSADANARWSALRPLPRRFDNR